MQITKDIFYIGVNDHNVDLFEGQYPVPNAKSVASVTAFSMITVLDYPRQNNRIFVVLKENFLNYFIVMTKILFFCLILRLNSKQSLKLGVAIFLFLCIIITRNICNIFVIFKERI